MHGRAFASQRGLIIWVNWLTFQLILQAHSWPFPTFSDCTSLNWMMVKLIIEYVAAAENEDNGGSSLSHCHSLIVIIILSLAIKPVIIAFLVSVMAFFPIWNSNSFSCCVTFSSCGITPHLTHLGHRTFPLVLVPHGSALVVQVPLSVGALFWFQFPMGRLQGVSIKSIIKVWPHEHKGESWHQVINLPSIYWPLNMWWVFCWWYMDEPISAHMRLVIR